MKTLLLVATMAVGSAGQSAGGPIEGSWTAQHEGRTFVRLELRMENGALAGGLSIGDIEVDAKGAVRRAGEPPRDLTPLIDVARRGSVVTFARKDGADTDRFELRFLDDGGAELHFLLNDADREELAADGVPVPKPIRLTRQ